MRLVLICDAPHDREVKQTFGGDVDSGLDDWCRDARAAGWQLRIGNDGMTLCRLCGRDWGGRSTVKEQPRQLGLFP